MRARTHTHTVTLGYDWTSFEEGTCKYMKMAPVLTIYSYNPSRITPNELDLFKMETIQRLITGWMIGRSGFESRRGLGIFHFDNVSRQAQGPTQPPIQWVPAAVSLGVKQPGREEADHSPPTNAEVKECVELYLHSRICLHGVMLS
jgi:hypothetical protein